jgi:CheY-like chemotaxis protein
MPKVKTTKIAEHLFSPCFGKSVLLIDPDEINHQLHRLYLKKYGLKLTCTKSLRHALWLVQEQPPDLILTEIYFKGHLHYEHLFWLRMEKFMPIIVQTCQSPLKHEELCMIRGADAYITKPIEWDRYVAVVLQCLVK